MRVVIRVLILVAGCSLDGVSAANESPVIQVHTLTAAPTLDDDAADWSTFAVIVVPLRKTFPAARTATSQVTIRAGTYQQRVYFLLQ